MNAKSYLMYKGFVPSLSTFTMNENSHDVVPNGSLDIKNDVAERHTHQVSKFIRKAPCRIRSMLEVERRKSPQNP